MKRADTVTSTRATPRLGWIEQATQEQQGLHAGEGKAREAAELALQGEPAQRPSRSFYSLRAGTARGFTWEDGANLLMAEQMLRPFAVTEK
jgi:hypothetical protein